MQMTGYTKLFGSIVASTIWREPHTVRIVWITMLAMANKKGVVEASLPGLADLSRVSIAECSEAIKALSSPDEYSRTPDYEGRRIETAEGGWHILNHAKYREKMGLDERRSYLREKQQEHRAKKKSEAPVSTNVNNGSDLSTPSTHAQSQSESVIPPAKARVKKEPSGDHAKFIKLWTDAYPQYHDGEKYVFQAGKDASAVKQLLETTGKTPEGLMDLAEYAWKHPGFYTKFAAAIATFNSQYTQIREECRTLHAKSKQTNGHAANGTNVPAAFQVPMNKPPQRPAHLDDPRT